MKKANHPTESREITLDEYFAEFGGKHNRDNGQERPRARCTECGRGLRINNEDSVEAHKRRWAHIGTPNNPYYCALKTDPSQRYTFLDTPATQTAAGHNLRASFFEHWEFHLRQMRRNLKGFIDIKEFIDIIRTADKVHFWHRENLLEWHIPYIFFVWQDYKPITKHNGEVLRSEWFRFWFSDNIQNFNQVVTAQNFPKIVRGNYDKPNRGLPKAEHLIDSHKVWVNDVFLNEPLTKEENKWVVNEMHKAFHHEVPATK